MRNIISTTLAAVVLIGGIGVVGCSVQQNDQQATTATESTTYQTDTITVTKDVETDLSKIIVAMYGKDAKIHNLVCRAGSASVDETKIICHMDSIFDFELEDNSGIRSKTIKVQVRE